MWYKNSSSILVVSLKLYCSCMPVGLSIYYFRKCTSMLEVRFSECFTLAIVILVTSTSNIVKASSKTPKFIEQGSWFSKICPKQKEPISQRKLLEDWNLSLFFFLLESFYLGSVFWGEKKKKTLRYTVSSIELIEHLGSNSCEYCWNVLFQLLVCEEGEFPSEKCLPTGTISFCLMFVNVFTAKTFILYLVFS